jgi:rod shape determining protein RodA
MKGTQTRYDFVPEQRTDFIFCTVGEGFGFVGSALLLALYLLLLLKIVEVAERQRSTFSRCYAYGVASVVFFHVMVNIGMTLGLVPVIGIPLPFMSYGGTALITFTVLLAILVKLDADRQMILR